MVRPTHTLPPKLPPGVAAAGPPSAHFPLTSANMATNLDKVLRQLHSYDLTQQQAYRELTSRLYLPGATFHYPLARVQGREAIVAFWDLFLLVRAIRGMNVHHMNVDVTWDPDKLQALVQIESWFHPKSLAWVERLILMPFGKVWSSQVFQFEACPSDGPGALRVAFQEELADQFIYLGLLPLGVYTLRTDPGTPLNWLLDTARGLLGHGISLGTPVVMQLLQAAGVVKR